MNRSTRVRVSSLRRGCIAGTETRPLFLPPIRPGSLESWVWPLLREARSLPLLKCLSIGLKARDGGFLATEPARLKAERAARFGNPDPT